MKVIDYQENYGAVVWFTNSEWKAVKGLVREELGDD